MKPVYVSLLISILISGCTYYENEVDHPPIPKTSKPTTSLQAVYTASHPNAISAAYWKTADYLPIQPQNLVTGQIPADDGLYNVSGTLSGTSVFNQGKDPKIQLKAAYDNDSLYILITWKDTTYDASKGNWLFDGPTDPNKAGSTSGWTSQRSEDQFILSFDQGTNKRDIWNWSLALSEPLGYAIDMNENSGIKSNDTGNKTFVRNNAGTDNRGGPLYDWDGVEQTLSRKPGGLTILDPGFYLLNKKTFSGNVINGDVIFQAECASCHGTTGDGEGTVNPVGIRLNKPGQFNRLTRTALDDFAAGPNHEGATHYQPLTEAERNDLFARLRGFSGIPGYYLQNPNGSNSDVRALSNVLLAKIDPENKKGYSVLLIRALNTLNSDDIVFNPQTGTYNFHFFVSDNDDVNRIGKENLQLTFLPK